MCIRDSIWTVGVRLDTAYRSAISLGFRLAYVRRTGPLAGSGGRGGAVLNIRFIRQLALYVEGGADVLDVPQNDDAIFSYSAYFGAGLRFVIAR